MCTCRQMLVFRIEKQYDGSVEFPGGSNKSVVEDINNLGSGEVPIETHDFVTFTRNWLDIIKCAVFLGCFWITLAIVFLAGTARVNIFSVGYLIGSFIFLWQGADFYLRPIQTILRWWRYLVAYNIFVISIKIFLHLPVCVFIDTIEKQLTSACFLIKLLGIMCLKNDIRNRFDLSASVIFLLLQMFYSLSQNFLINDNLLLNIFKGKQLRSSRRRHRFKLGLLVLCIFNIPTAYLPELLFLPHNQ